MKRIFYIAVLAAGFCMPNANAQTTKTTPKTEEQLIAERRADKFRMYSVDGTQLNLPKISEFLNRSLMLVTALSPVIGYDQASAIAHAAMDKNLTLREAALASGFIAAGKFDEIVDPAKMV